MKKLLFILPALFFSLIFTTCEKNPIPDPNDFYFRSKINGKLYIPNGCANCMSGMLLGDTTFLMNGNAGYESIAIGIINVTGQPITTMSYF